MTENYLVYVDCPTYNHSPFIKDSLDGFCLQKTSFPFVCGIVDDASTDGEQDVIQHYLEDNFDLDDHSTVSREETDDYVRVFAQHKTNRNCFFIVFYLKSNHYQNNKTRYLYITQWMRRAKYIAVCEGDDYWISPDKLQKQVELLENNPAYSLACNRTKLFSVRQNRFIGESYCYEKSRVVDPKDVINRAGAFITTCSFLYRSELREIMPSYCAKCKVGDYPLMLLCALKGMIYYINDTMSVYRVENSNSWMGQQKWGHLDRKRLEIVRSIVEMLKGFGEDFPEYNSLCKAKIADQINRNLPYRQFPKEVIKDYLSFFSVFIKNYTLRWKIDLLIRRSRLPLVRRYYTDCLMKKYSERILLY